LLQGYNKVINTLEQNVAALSITQFMAAIKNKVKT